MNIIRTPRLRHSIKRTLSMIDGILPFTEKPSSNHFEHDSSHTENKGSRRRFDIGACELFSLFTADIIKEEIVFTR